MYINLHACKETSTTQTSISTYVTAAIKTVYINRIIYFI